MRTLRIAGIVILAVVASLNVGALVWIVADAVDRQPVLIRYQTPIPVTIDPQWAVPPTPTPPAVTAPLP